MLQACPEQACPDVMLSRVRSCSAPKPGLWLGVVNPRGLVQTVSLTVLLASVPSSAFAQVFKATVDLVNFGVTVVDKKGNLVTDLGLDDFEIVEDGGQQTATFLARGDDEATAPSLHLGLLLDTSGSMEEDIKFARSASVKFLNALQEAVDITLVDFDTEVRVARYGQNDFARLVERIRHRKPDGWTALYDAVGVYLDGAGAQTGRKVLVLYTDGGDTTSTMNFADMMTLLKASDVTVYAIGLIEHQLASTRSDSLLRLQQIAEATGGQAFFPSSMPELESIYDRIAEELHAQYSLGYSSTNQRADGEWRRVAIRVKRANLQGAKVRTRKGYFAPYKETESR